MPSDDFTIDGKSLYQLDLTALNNSGVSGHAVLLVDRDSQSITVDIQASGLEPGQMHIQHIHGFEDGTESRAPTIAQDTDGDGFVELAEGATTYGPILLNLTLNPENSAHDHGEGHDHTAEAVFPVADAMGRIDYHETFTFAGDNPTAQAIFAGLLPLDAREIVLHGESTNAAQGAGTGGEVDGTAGYKLVLPVAVGEVQAVTSAADVLAATELLGGDVGPVIDWEAVAAQVTANYEATGHWFL